MAPNERDAAVAELDAVIRALAACREEEADVMIEAFAVICQEQLSPSSAADRVITTYPNPNDPTKTVLGCLPGGQMELRPNGTDGAWEQAEVLPNGNLLYRVNGVGYIVLGASLKPL